MSPTDSTPTSNPLSEIATKHEVPEVVVKATYLNVNTFALQEPLVFLNLCMHLDDKRIDTDSPAAQAIEKWGLGMILGEGHFNMSSVVEDVMRFVEKQFTQAVETELGGFKG